MARRIHYRIEDRSDNSVTDEEWEEIKRLEWWYNSEFVWTAGRLAFKMYAIFPDRYGYAGSDENDWKKIRDRFRFLRIRGLSENEAIRQLQKEGFILVKKGGYQENCIASGYTRVAGNEFNAYLVCEYLLKCSIIARNAAIHVLDDGEFIKCGSVIFRNGFVNVPFPTSHKRARVEKWVRSRRIFSVVDPSKYDDLPEFRNVVHGFNKMDQEKRRRVLEDWNWLGFANRYDSDGDDHRGYDLNLKVRGIEMVEASGMA